MVRSPTSTPHLRANFKCVLFEPNLQSSDSSCFSTTRSVCYNLINFVVKAPKVAVSPSMWASRSRWSAILSNPKQPRKPSIRRALRRSRTRLRQRLLSIMLRLMRSRSRILGRFATQKGLGIERMCNLKEWRRQCLFASCGAARGSTLAWCSVSYRFSSFSINDNDGTRLDLKTIAF